ncbi:MAG: type II secretion system F family protein [Gammaproteobacteria bacterium]|nr:type II secretion system F family protein [Gammaproteobacteria bacterium]
MAVKPDTAPRTTGGTVAQDNWTTYAWSGTDRRGKTVRGELKAPNESQVKADLRRQGVIAKSVRKKTESLTHQLRNRISPKDIAMFTRQLATMVSAGVPLVQSLDIAGRGHEKTSMQELILGVKNDIQGGASLSEAMRKRPQYFDRLFTSLVHAGEQAGILESLLVKIASYKEKIESIKGKIKKALFYPTAVLIVALLISAALLIFVVPQFQSLFSSFGADLPVPTKIVIMASKNLQEWWWVYFAVIVGSWIALSRSLKRSPATRDKIDRLMLKLPIIGDLLVKAIIARFSRTLATMFAAGVPLVEALSSVADATGNQLYCDAVLRIREEVATGQQLQAAMQHTGLFPNMVVQMVAVGEESGSLDHMLTKVADIFEEEVDDAVAGLSSLIEPMIMVILGVLIGGLVVAMYLPIFKMGQVF